MKPLLKDNVDPSILVNHAVKIALEAGKILKQGYGTLFKINSKDGNHDLVTEYDFLSEKRILQMIQEVFPDHHILSEEIGEIGKEHTYQWIIDPLDGTVNFAHGIPIFSISIGVIKNNECICGVVYNPITNELFVAEKGKGAFLNGSKLSVSTTTSIDKAILAAGLLYKMGEDPSSRTEHFSKILRLGIPIRRMGAASLDLCYVAAGRFDGYWDKGLYPWDCAAGNLIIEEAGGKVTTWGKEEFNIYSRKPILASNTNIHEQIYQILAQETEY
jgi:myo-inositol-1(or 4)-monophosphatase